MKQNDFFIGSQPKNNYSLLKKSIIGALLLCPFLHLSAQTTTTVLENYDGTSTVALQTAAGTTSGTFSIAPNPGSNVVNASTNVAKYVRSTNPYDAIFFDTNGNTPDALPFHSGAYKILIDVYSTAAIGTGVTVNFENKAKATAGFPIGRNSDYRATTTKQNEWETLTFTVNNPNLDAGTLNSEVDQIVFLFNPGAGGNTDTYYFDNVRIVKSPINLALGKTAVASTGVAGQAVDGNIGSRWESAHGSDNEWIYVDLGADYALNRVVLKWEGAYATEYKVQISSDATFTDAETVSTNTNPTGITTFPYINDLTVSGTGRYLRILGVSRATIYGYSLWEIEAYANTPTTLGINDITGNNTPSVALYPNPAHDFVKISSTEKLNNTVVTIYDLLGKQVLQSKLDDSKEESLININQLAKGTYILNINSDGKNFSKKLIKK